MQKLLDATGFIIKIWKMYGSHRFRFLNQLENSGQRTHKNLSLSRFRTLLFSMMKPVKMS